MNLITPEELKEKLDRGDPVKLVMALGGWYFRAVRIPGSISVSSLEEALAVLDKDDEIVVYCTDEACPASKLMLRVLLRAGYRNVRRCEGGIFAWQQAGYPVEGEQVKAEPAAA